MSRWMLLSLFLLVARIDPNQAGSECGIYFAPSTIPGAGKGLFAGKAYRENETMTPGDIVIALVDYPTHNADIDTTTLVLQSYYWLTYAFAGMEEESEHSLAFSPGAGAAINCFFPMLNVQGEDEAIKVNNAGLHRSKDPGAGAFTPFHDRTTYAVRDIQAGEELFTWYGEDYFDEDTFGMIPFLDSYTTADDLLKKYISLRESLCAESETCTKSGTSPMASTNPLHHDWYGMLTKLSSFWPSRVLNALPQDPTIVDEIAEIGTSNVHYNRSIRSLDWLEENGICMDNIEAGPSAIKQAGRGAFATRHIPKGSIVGPAPLVHLNRTVLNMYPARYYAAGFYGDEYHEDGFYADIHAPPVNYQLLLNYCFGHRHSSLVLCPYGMVTGLINHSAEKANAKVVWNYNYMKNPEWLEKPLEEWILEVHVGLQFDFIATKDIQKGEEVYIDYGNDWEAAWEEHVSKWKPPLDAAMYSSASDLNDDIDLTVRTIDEGSYSANYVNVLCLEPYRVWSGLPDLEHESFYCRATQRYEKDGMVLYTAELYGHIEEEDDDVCYEELLEVVWDIPRDAFYFEDVPYSRDTAQTWSFRSSIGIPNDIMPKVWMDLLE